MKLSLSDIKRITSGAVRIYETENGIGFNRFTEEQEEFFRKFSERYYSRSLCTAGVILRFTTDSSTLFIKVRVTLGSVATFFAFDVVVNKERRESLCNFNEDELPPNYSGINFSLGEFSKSFELGTGEKTVEIHLPYNQRVELLELSLVDGSYIRPVRREKRMLVYGDSITQGFNALHPADRYAARLCEYLGAEEMCKAISGDMFRPKEASFKDDFIPDYISVAYGTNDWGGGTDGRSAKDIEDSCRKFCMNLRINYPETPILLITPVWRKDSTEPRRSGKFDDLENILRNAVANIYKLAVVSGRKLMPEDPYLFGDLRLHPNDKGFGHYAGNLIAKLEETDFKEVF